MYRPHHEMLFQYIDSSESFSGDFIIVFAIEFITMHSAVQLAAKLYVADIVLQNIVMI